MKRAIISLVIAAISLFVFQTNAAAGNDKPIKVSQLPPVARQLINTHFAKKRVALAKQETEVFDKSYDVVFATGEKIEFDRKGNWTEIDCKYRAVPSPLVPAPIMSYVKSHYPRTKIVSIEKDKKGYEIKLSNRIEITFNKHFQVVDID